MPFGKRGALLDEHLAAWEGLWRDTPASFAGEHYAYDDVYLEPKAWRPDGPRLWLGGESVHPRLLRRIVRYAHGFHPLGQPSDEDMAPLRDGLSGGRAGSRRARARRRHARRLPGRPQPVAARAGDRVDPGAAESAGFTTFCIKPSQFIDEPAHYPAWCREVVERVGGVSSELRQRAEHHGRGARPRSVSVLRVGCAGMSPVCFVPAVGLWFVTRWARRRGRDDPADLFSSQRDALAARRGRWAETAILAPRRRAAEEAPRDARPLAPSRASSRPRRPAARRAARRRLLDGIAERGEAELMSELLRARLGALARPCPRARGYRRRHVAPLVPRARAGSDQLRGRPGAAGSCPTRPAARSIASLRPSSSGCARARTRARRSRRCCSTPTGTLDERVAAILPTLKVILLGGMQEPGPRRGLDRRAGCSSRARPRPLAADPAGSFATRSRRGFAGSPRSARRRGVRARRRARRRRSSRQAPTSASSSPPRTATRSVWGPTRRHASTSSDRSATTRRSDSGRTSAPVIISPACRCASPCNGCSSGFPTFASDPDAAAGLQRLGVSGAADLARSVGRRDGGRFRACRTSPTATLREGEAGDLSLAVARVGERYVAFESWCTHEECPLSDGWIEGEAIRCACHGALFSLTTERRSRGRQRSRSASFRPGSRPAAASRSEL